MQKILFLLLFALAPFAKTAAQSLPPNTCGVVFTYDAAGNRMQRMYVCNNARKANDTAVIATLKQLGTTEMAQVSALYPNPTSGIFQVTFTRALKQAQITFIDLGGHILQQSVASGNVLTYDISSYPPGVYWIRVTEGRYTATHKVIKQ